MRPHEEPSARLGDPLAPPITDNGESAAPDTDPGTTRREGDTGLGVPEFEARKTRTLSREETEEYRQTIEERMRHQAEAILEDLEHDHGWRLPRSLRNAFSAIMLAIAAIMGMFLTTQTVQFFADVKTMPGWSRWIATGAMALFSIVLACVFLGLLWGILRLQRAPRLHLKAMKILSERRQLQRFASLKQNEARKKLQRYLRDYPLSGKDRKRLTALGLKDANLASIDAARNRLLDESRPVSNADWLDDFQKGFQGTLDEMAQRRVRQYARRIGIGTAASPIAIVDQMIVLYGCVAMVKDLFAIYNLRPAFGQTVLTLARSVVHTYLSGMLEDITETAIDGLGALEDVAGDGLGILTGTVGKAVSAKAAEAGLNSLLIWRLGRKTITLLQPVVVTGTK